MKYTNDTSLYFRLPIGLKEEFDHICTVDRMTMTQTLNTFIKGFIEAKRDENPALYVVCKDKPTKWLARGGR